MFLEIDHPHKLMLEYNIWGKGEPLVFLHGGGTDYHYYEPFLVELSKKYKVYAFSYPGFGKSSNVQKYDIDLFLAIIDQFLLQMNINDFILLGHSMGGGMATYFASHNKKYNIKKLILLSPNTTPIKKNIIKLALDLRKQHGIEARSNTHYFDLIENYKLKNYQDNIFNLKYLINVIKQYQFISSTNFIQNYENIKIPILLFWGDKDLVLGTNTFENAWKKMENENIKIKVFEGYGHNFFFPKYLDIIKLCSK